MENIILSLLLIKSMTVYEIRMFIQRSLNTVCSDSMGSIQSGIKKLMEKGCITVHEYREGSMIKKEYSITEKGMDQFKQWIEIPMDIQKVKNMEEAKFFFLGMAKKETRIRSLQNYIESLEKEQENLKNIQIYAERMKSESVDINVARISEEKNLSAQLIEVSGENTLTEAVQNIYDYQIYNLHYGLNRLAGDIKFYQSILDKELAGER